MVALDSCADGGLDFASVAPPMTHRHAISEAGFDRIRNLLSDPSGQHGGVAREDRRFLDAVLRVAQTAAAWADLPERLGNGNSQWRRFEWQAAKGLWDPIPAALREPDLDILILYWTAVRAHPFAVGAKKNRTAPAAWASRRSAAAGAGSARRSTPVATGSGIRSS